MYDEKIQNTILSNLEQKVINLVETDIALLAQGYIINKAKKVKLDWFSILYQAFESIDIFDEEQKHNIELLYNSL